MSIPVMFVRIRTDAVAERLHSKRQCWRQIVAEIVCQYELYNQSRMEQALFSH